MRFSLAINAIGHSSSDSKASTSKQAGRGAQTTAPTEAASLDLHDVSDPEVLKQRVTAMEVLTPHDLEKQFGMTGGQWHHGDAWPPPGVQPTPYYLRPGGGNFRVVHGSTPLSY